MYAWKVTIDINSTENFITILTSKANVNLVSDIFVRYFCKTPFNINDIEFVGRVINYRKGKTMENDEDYVLPTLNLRLLEREAIIIALKKHKGKQNLAARELGISNRAINYRIHKIHKIKVPKNDIC